MFCTTQLQNSPLPAPARQEGLLRVAEGDCQLHRIRGLVWTRRPGAGASAFCLSAGGVHPALGREPLIPPPHPLPECCLKFDCSCLKIKKKKKMSPGLLWNVGGNGRLFNRRCRRGAAECFCVCGFASVTGFRSGLMQGGDGGSLAATRPFSPWPAPRA